MRRAWTCEGRKPVTGETWEGSRAMRRGNRESAVRARMRATPEVVSQKTYRSERCATLRRQIARRKQGAVRWDAGRKKGGRRRRHGPQSGAKASFHIKRGRAPSLRVEDRRMRRFGGSMSGRDGIVPTSIRSSLPARACAAGTRRDGKAERRREGREEERSFFYV